MPGAQRRATRSAGGIRSRAAAERVRDHRCLLGEKRLFLPIRRFEKRPRLFLLAENGELEKARPFLEAADGQKEKLFPEEAAMVAGALGRKP